MSDEWLTMTEAAAKLGVSERTVQRRVANGDYETKTEHSRKYVRVGDADINADTNSTDEQIADSFDNVSDKVIKMQQEKIEMQKEQIEHLKQLLDDALQDARESKERGDTIVLSLTRQMDEQVKMIEDMRERKNIWQKIKAKFMGRAADTGGKVT